jgi:hypothetical protein
VGVYRSDLHPHASICAGAVGKLAALAQFSERLKLHGPGTRSALHSAPERTSVHTAAARRH